MDATQYLGLKLQNRRKLPDYRPVHEACKKFGTIVFLFHCGKKICLPLRVDIFELRIGALESSKHKRKNTHEFGFLSGVYKV